MLLCHRDDMCFEWQEAETHCTHPNLSMLLLGRQ